MLLQSDHLCSGDEMGGSYILARDLWSFGEDRGDPYYVICGLLTIHALDHGSR